ncbi:hypothetical protein EVA_21775, partial [gut metagenome]
KISPLRQTELKGNQLTENLYPKNGKRKAQTETDFPEVLEETTIQEEVNNDNQPNQ